MNRTFFYINDLDALRAKMARGSSNLWDSGKVVSDESAHIPYAGGRAGSQMIGNAATDHRRQGARDIL
jgi:hypothetical protein